MMAMRIGAVKLERPGLEDWYVFNPNDGEGKPGLRLNGTDILGAGSFGEVYKGSLVQKKEDGTYETLNSVAVKLEEIQFGIQSQLERESHIYTLMNGTTGFPRMHFYGETHGFRIMAMDYLGPSVEEMWERCNRRFSLKSVLMMAEQMITLIEELHKNGFIHRDIKPENFLVGFGKNSGVINMIDFGLAKRYTDPQTGAHIPCVRKHDFTGTLKYCSGNTHAGVEQSRRDDLEAVAYISIHLLKEFLPWDALMGLKLKQKLFSIGVMKRERSAAQLCSNMPEEFAIYLDYCRKLKFDAEPNYNYCRGLFHKVAANQGLSLDDNITDWNVNIIQNILQREKEQEKIKERELKKEKEREIEMEKAHKLEKERELELEKQKELEKERELELEKQKELEKEKEQELEKMRQLQKEEERKRSEARDLEREQMRNERIKELQMRIDNLRLAFKQAEKDQENRNKQQGGRSTTRQSSRSAQDPDLIKIQLEKAERQLELYERQIKRDKDKEKQKQKELQQQTQVPSKLELETLKPKDILSKEDQQKDSETNKDNPEGSAPQPQQQQQQQQQPVPDPQIFWEEYHAQKRKEALERIKIRELKRMREKEKQIEKEIEEQMKLKEEKELREKFAREKEIEKIKQQLKDEEEKKNKLEQEEREQRKQIREKKLQELRDKRKQRESMKLLIKYEKGKSKDIENEKQDGNKDKEKEKENKQEKEKQQDKDKDKENKQENKKDQKLEQIKEQIKELEKEQEKEKAKIEEIKKEKVKENNQQLQQQQQPPEENKSVQLDIIDDDSSSGLASLVDTSQFELEQQEMEKKIQNEELLDKEKEGEEKLDRENKAKKLELLQQQEQELQRLQKQVDEIKALDDEEQSNSMEQTISFDSVSLDTNNQIHISLISQSNLASEFNFSNVEDGNQQQVENAKSPRQQFAQQTNPAQISQRKSTGGLIPLRDFKQDKISNMDTLGKNKDEEKLKDGINQTQAQNLISHKSQLSLPPHSPKPSFFDISNETSNKNNETSSRGYSKEQQSNIQSKLKLQTQDSGSRLMSPPATTTTSSSSSSTTSIFSPQSQQANSNRTSSPITTNSQMNVNQNPTKILSPIGSISLSPINQPKTPDNIQYASASVSPSQILPPISPSQDSLKDFDTIQLSARDICPNSPETNTEQFGTQLLPDDFGDSPGTNKEQQLQKESKLKISEVSRDDPSPKRDQTPPISMIQSPIILQQQQQQQQQSGYNTLNKMSKSQTTAVLNKMSPTIRQSDQGGMMIQRPVSPKPSIIQLSKAKLSSREHQQQQQQQQTSNKAQNDKSPTREQQTPLHKNFSNPNLPISNDNQQNDLSSRSKSPQSGKQKFVIPELKMHLLSPNPQLQEFEKQQQISLDNKVNGSNSNADQQQKQLQQHQTSSSSSSSSKGPGPHLNPKLIEDIQLQAGSVKDRSKESKNLNQTNTSDLKKDKDKVKDKDVTKDKSDEEKDKLEQIAKRKKELEERRREIEEKKKKDETEDKRKKDDEEKKKNEDENRKKKEVDDKKKKELEEKRKEYDEKKKDSDDKRKEFDEKKKDIDDKKKDIDEKKKDSEDKRKDIDDKRKDVDDKKKDSEDKRKKEYDEKKKKEEEQRKKDEEERKRKDEELKKKREELERRRKEIEDRRRSKEIDQNSEIHDEDKIKKDIDDQIKKVDDQEKRRKTETDEKKKIQETEKKRNDDENEKKRKEEFEKIKKAEDEVQRKKQEIQLLMQMMQQTQEKTKTQSDEKEKENPKKEPDENSSSIKVSLSHPSKHKATNSLDDKSSYNERNITSPSQLQQQQQQQDVEQQKELDAEREKEKEKEKQILQMKERDLLKLPTKEKDNALIVLLRLALQQQQKLSDKSKQIQQLRSRVDELEKPISKLNVSFTSHRPQYHPQQDQSNSQAKSDREMNQYPSKSPQMSYAVPNQQLGSLFYNPVENASPTGDHSISFPIPTSPIVQSISPGQQQFIQEVKQLGFPQVAQFYDSQPENRRKSAHSRHVSVGTTSTFALLQGQNIQQNSPSPSPEPIIDQQIISYGPSQTQIDKDSNQQKQTTKSYSGHSRSSSQQMSGQHQSTQQLQPSQQSGSSTTKKGQTRQSVLNTANPGIFSPIAETDQLNQPTTPKQPNLIIDSINSLSPKSSQQQYLTASQLLNPTSPERTPLPTQPGHFKSVARKTVNNVDQYQIRSEQSKLRQSVGEKQIDNKERQYPDRQPAGGGLIPTNSQSGGRSKHLLDRSDIPILTSVSPQPYMGQNTTHHSRDTQNFSPTPISPANTGQSRTLKRSETLAYSPTLQREQNPHHEKNRSSGLNQFKSEGKEDESGNDKQDNVFRLFGDKPLLGKSSSSNKLDSTRSSKQDQEQDGKHNRIPSFDKKKEEKYKRRDSQGQYIEQESGRSSTSDGGIDKSDRLDEIIANSYIPESNADKEFNQSQQFNSLKSGSRRSRSFMSLEPNISKPPSPIFSSQPGSGSGSDNFNKSNKTSVNPDKDSDSQSQSGKGSLYSSQTSGASRKTPLDNPQPFAPYTLSRSQTHADVNSEKESDQQKYKPSKNRDAEEDDGKQTLKSIRSSDNQSQQKESKNTGDLSSSSSKSQTKNKSPMATQYQQLTSPSPSQPSTHATSPQSHQTVFTSAFSSLISPTQTVHSSQSTQQPSQSSSSHQSSTSTSDQQHHQQPTQSTASQSQIHLPTQSSQSHPTPSNVSTQPLSSTSSSSSQVPPKNPNKH